MIDRRNFILKTGMLACSGLVLGGNSLAELRLSDIKRIKPKALKAGDTIAITSPAGAVWDEAQIETFSNILKGFGFNIILGKTLKEKHGYFAGTDVLRANELNDLFANKKIKGIFCMKGGWGCARLLDKLDYKIIKENPKVLIGFSDITTLLIAITTKTGLITYHGPVGNSGWNDFTKNSFINVVQNTKPYTFEANPANEDAILTINSGKANGELVGGNLTVLTSIIGSGYLPDWKGKILFLEEAKEEPYSIDRMLTQLKLSGVLDSVNGIIFGKCAKCLAEEPLKSFTLNEVLLQHFKPLKIPVFFGAMIGHIENKLTVPIGIKASIDADKGTISLLESSVY
ncbi:MAG: LD-carboxypeptidase [Bacteroidia bacterium]|nr:LD-carboxypeptidase [Bacteroidia bacterium]